LPCHREGYERKMAQGCLRIAGRERTAPVTEDIVVDTNVFIDSLLDENLLNSEEARQRPLVIRYIEGIVDGRYIVHLPRIAIIEIVGVTRRKAGAGAASLAKTRLAQWVDLGLVRLYDFQEARKQTAVDLAIRNNVSKRRYLSAPDAIFIGLADELEITLVTLEKSFSAASPRALVLP